MNRTGRTASSSEMVQIHSRKVGEARRRSNDTYLMLGIDPTLIGLRNCSVNISDIIYILLTFTTFTHGLSSRPYHFIEMLDPSGSRRQALPASMDALVVDRCHQQLLLL
jgi:hypothetical protein